MPLLGDGFNPNSMLIDYTGAVNAQKDWANGMASSISGIADTTADYFKDQKDTQKKVDTTATQIQGAIDMGLDTTGSLKMSLDQLNDKNIPLNHRSALADGMGYNLSLAKDTLLNTQKQENWETTSAQHQQQLDDVTADRKAAAEARIEAARAKGMKPQTIIGSDGKAYKLSTSPDVGDPQSNNIGKDPATLGDPPMDYYNPDGTLNVDENTVGVSATGGPGVLPPLAPSIRSTASASSQGSATPATGQSIAASAAIPPVDYSLADNSSAVAGSTDGAGTQTLAASVRAAANTPSPSPPTLSVGDAMAKSGYVPDLAANKVMAETRVAENNAKLSQIKINNGGLSEKELYAKQLADEAMKAKKEANIEEAIKLRDRLDDLQSHPGYADIWGHSKWMTEARDSTKFTEGTENTAQANVLRTAAVSSETLKTLGSLKGVFGRITNPEFDSIKKSASLLTDTNISKPMADKEIARMRVSINKIIASKDKSVSDDSDQSPDLGNSSSLPANPRNSVSTGQKHDPISTLDDMLKAK